MKIENEMSPLKLFPFSTEGILPVQTGVKGSRTHDWHWWLPVDLRSATHSLLRSTLREHSGIESQEVVWHVELKPPTRPVQNVIYFPTPCTGQASDTSPHVIDPDYRSPRRSHCSYSIYQKLHFNMNDTVKKTFKKNNEWILKNTRITIWLNWNERRFLDYDFIEYI